MEKDFKIIRGDTFSFMITIENFTDDLDSCYFSCKKNPYDNEYVFQKSLENGITKIETGKYKIRVAPEDTKNKETGTYLYDLQIGIGEDIHTILIGEFIIQKEITEETYGRI